MGENGEIYTAGKNFTLPLELTALTNSWPHSIETGESDKTLTGKSVGQLVTANLTSWTQSDGCLSFSVTRQKILEPKFGHQLAGAMAKLANSQLDENSLLKPNKPNIVLWADHQLAGLMAKFARSHIRWVFRWSPILAAISKLFVCNEIFRGRVSSVHFVCFLVVGQAGRQART